MALLLTIVALVIVTLVLLRMNKLRRDARRSSSAPFGVANEPRSAIRIVDGDANAPMPSPVIRPSVDVTRSYVFGENAESMPSVTSVSSSKERWALSKSAHRSRIPRGSSKVLFFAIGVIAILVVTGTLLAQR